MSSGGGPTQRGIGRSRELAAAAFARDTARSGVGGVLAVVGPAGSGKTWLCEAVAEAARTEGFRVGWGTGWPGEGVPPLWPWQQALGPFGDRDATVELLGDPPAADDPAWFGRAVAVVDALRRLAAEQPLLLVLDDLHHADEPTRRLARFVARHVRGLPLVLLVAHQPDDDLAALDAEASPLALRGLDPGETAALLAARGVEGLAGADLAFVARASEGLPGTLHHLANAAGPGAPSGVGGPGGIGGPGAIGAGGSRRAGGAAAGVVAALVDLRVAELPELVRRAAAHAAVADRSPRLAEVAAIAPDVRVSPGLVADELERRGLAGGRTAEGFAFAHEQVRVALAATLDPAEVLDIHARVAGLLAGPPPTLDRRRRRAEHALAAAPRSAADAGLAVQAVHDVAADLLAANQADLAAELLAAAESAHEAAGGAGPVAALLATRGRALQRGGRLAAARGQFHRAAGAAEAEGDAESLAVAVLGLGGVWLAEERSPLDRERFLHLHRRATRALPDTSSALRLRLDVRRAAEDAYVTGSLDEIEAQVATARGFGDPALLAEALSLYHHTILGPAHRHRRAAVADEMLAAAARAGDDWLGLMALLWLTADQFLAGSPRAEQSVRELHDRAAAINGRHAGYIAKVMDATLLQRAGRLAEAEAAAGVAYAAGTEVGDADAVAYFGGQLVTLRWIQGRADEVLDLAAETATSPTITPLNRAFTATQASLAAAAGDLDRARVALRRLRGELRGIHQSSAWLVTLYSVVEAAHVLGDAEMAAEAAELLAPYAELPVVGSLGVSCLGSVRRSLGLAAVTVGDLDGGIALLEQAVADNERLGNLPLAAMTGADLAAAHRARGAPGDDAAADTLLARSIREAEAMSLTRRAEEWQALRGSRTPRDPDGGGRRATTNVDASPEPGGPEGTIELRGRSWRLCAAGHEVVVPDLLGMQYLVQLLVNPGVEIAATELVGDGSDPAAAAVHDTTDQPLLDPAALAAYRSRVAELEDDLAEAERNADPERATRARLELDAVVDELTRSTGRLGRSRRFSSPAERARTAVQKAVRRALDQVEKADARLGAALRASVRTGRTCCYDPAPGAPTTWHRL